MPGVRPPIRAIGVIGAGKVGRDIALAAAMGGYRTILEDLLPNALRRAEYELRKILDQAIKSGILSPDAADAVFSRLEFAGTVEDAARQSDLVIEAGPEELESKIEIFTLLDMAENTIDRASEITSQHAIGTNQMTTIMTACSRRRTRPTLT